MSSSALLDADASRSRSGILTPSSEASLNRHDGGFSPDDRKRKRTSSTPMDYLLKQSIAIKPHPPNLHVQPRVLQPLMLLPRQYLPLASIDFTASNSDLSHSRFVESHIKILDLESRVGTAASVLIARYESKGAVYAIERQGNGLHVVCRLGSWVNLEALAEHATAVLQERIRPSRTDLVDQPKCTATTTPQLHHESKKKRAAIEAIQSLVKKRARSQSISTLQDLSPVEDAIEPKQEQAQPLLLPLNSCAQDTTGDVVEDPLSALPFAGLDQPEDLSPQQTSDSIFDTIRAQYFDALYKSMGSLAYFAKGPLSRARSAFHLDLEANLDMADLIGFLKSLILTTVQIDQKYRQSVPDVISKTNEIIDTSDEGKKKKRRTKKMKLGKDCLYPTEDEAIKSWWDATKPMPTDEETRLSAEQIKSHISLLRTRETQLQMIIIFEILALEPLKAPEDTGANDLPTLPGVVESQEMPIVVPPRKRNKHNLPVLLDVHADRLTIWQSIASDEQLAMGDSQMTTHSLDGQPQQNPSSEPLRDFCVDVIVPFFSARLPPLCDSISRKLGGPVIVSPPKSKAVKRHSSKREQKPGAVAKRPAIPNVPRTLQRALSTEQSRRSVSRGPGNMIALMRSATSTSLSTIKREGSESVASTTTQRGTHDLLGQRQGSLSRSQSMTNLEEAKSKKKALVEAELKDAISALRKPNRDVVGKALAETAQRQAATTLSMKRGKKPIQRSSSAVQVKATPTNFRFKDVLPVKRESAVEPIPFGMEETIPPSSIGASIPSTAPRRSHRDALPDIASPTLSAIGETPVRASMNPRFPRRANHVEMVIPPSSPIMGRDSTISEDFLGLEPIGKPLRRIDFSASVTDRICQTPVRKTMAREVVQEASTPQVETKEEKMSIYQQLGWDDDLDDLL